MKPVLIVAFLCFPLIPLAGGGCQSTVSTPSLHPHRPALINHIVFFSLTDPAQAEALIADCDAHLATIPGVVSYFCGQHVDTARATVVADYDVGFFVGFNSFEDYATYVEHPRHIEIVTKWRPMFESLTVRDVLDKTE